ncbi:hypothetical protein [Ruegeria lacuscaerulensis]|uniref:hypothetical protein n=1 Tax=Ruegeria lacuscaerulensis TaxID=55218 RepID=UPI00147CB7AD|nr:hypothetical protein [Ruegeria lacuscaerulensis]
MFLNYSSYKHLKTALWPIKGPVKSTHLHEGLACALGFSDYHELKCQLQEGGVQTRSKVSARHFNADIFLSRMAELGYRPGLDYRDPNAPVFNLAITALSIVEGDGFIDAVARSDLYRHGSVFRLDVTNNAWKEAVAAYRVVLARHWERPRWVMWLPRRWREMDQISIDRSALHVSAGTALPRSLDDSDQSAISAIKAETGETPFEMFGRVLTDLRPFLPGYNDNIDPIEEITFTNDLGLMVMCRVNNQPNYGNVSFRYEAPRPSF